MMPSLFLKNSGNANSTTGSSSTAKNHKSGSTSHEHKQKTKGGISVGLPKRGRTPSPVADMIRTAVIPNGTIEQRQKRESTASSSSSPLTVPPPPSLPPRHSQQSGGAVPAPDLQRFGRPPTASTSSSKHQQQQQYQPRAQPQHIPCAQNAKPESPNEQNTRRRNKDRSSLRLSAVVRGTSDGSGNSMSEPGGAIAYQQHTAVIPQGSLIESGSDLGGLTSSDNTQSTWWPSSGAGTTPGGDLIDSMRSLSSSNKSIGGGNTIDDNKIKSVSDAVAHETLGGSRGSHTAQSLTTIFRGETNGTRDTCETTDSERTNPMSNVSSFNHAALATNSRHPHGPLSSTLMPAAAPPFPPRPELIRTPSLVRQQSSRRMVSMTVPIEAQYAANFQLRQLFDQVFSQGPSYYLLSFEMGANFCENALYELPKHGYYHSKKHVQQRKQSNYDALRISDILQTVIVPRLSEQDLMQMEAPNNQNMQQMLLHQNFDPEQTRKHLLEEAKWLFSQAKDLADPVVHNDYTARRTRILKEATPSSSGTAAGNKKKNGGGFFSGRFPLPSINSKPKKVVPQGGGTKNSSRAHTQTELMQQQQQLLMYNEQQLTQQQATVHLPTATHAREASMEQIKADLISLSLCGIIPPSLIEQSSSFVDSDAPSQPRTMHASTKLNDNSRHTQAQLPPKNKASTNVYNQLIPVDDSKVVPPTSSPRSLSPNSKIYPSLKDTSGSPSYAPANSSATLSPIIAAGGAPNAHNEPCVADITASSTTTSKRDVVPVSVLKSMYAEDFIECLKRGTIQIQTFKTYQGRVPASTNGCTVIAPLLAIHYMQLTNKEYELSQDQIEQVIDQESCVILPQVRQELELTQDALIIPSDVHDHLIGIGLLSQDHFVGVTGGNIMDDWHIHELLKMLTSEGEHKSHRGKKVAATLFFHEHVVTILTLHRPQNAVTSTPSNIKGYELIDSLPSRETLFPNEAISTTSQDVIMEDVDETKLLDSPPPCNGVRYRCRDLESLQSLIKWYSISKFTPDDAAFIDELEWDDNDGRAPFDPRIFQAFVWAS